jgi:hypothetical protein
VFHIDKDVAAAATPERIIDQEATADQTNRPGFKVLHIQQKSGNTDTVDIGLSTTGLAAGFVPIHHLAAHAAGEQPQSLTVSVSDIPSVLRLEDIWIRVGTNGEGVIGFYIEQ